MSKTTKQKYSLSGNIVDVVNQRIYKGTLDIENGIISNIIEKPVAEDHYIVPGLIDAHVHVESSMVTPAQFAQKAVIHGTIAAVSDPHEIANVLGIEGVKFMITNGKQTPFKFFFGAPSCVPATSFESAGAIIDSKQVEEMLHLEDIYYLAEMMNFPGVMHNDPEVWAKLNAAKATNKPIDGHAPAIKGEDLKKYASGGITTDHECMNIEEAIEKINYNIKVQIREGSAAKNFEDLLPLVKTHPEMIMFCSDDKHPDELAQGHINELIKRAINLGYNAMDLLTICSKNIIDHYKLPVGLIQKGDFADFLIVDNLNSFNVLSTFIEGEEVASDGKCNFDSPQLKIFPNVFNAQLISKKALEVEDQNKQIKVIDVTEGQLYTKSFLTKLLSKDNLLQTDISQDILKIVVYNRYKKSVPAVAYVRGFGLKKGALASSIAHDSHNMVAVGVLDDDIVNAINAIISNKGGICASLDKEITTLPLPIAGIMSNLTVDEVGERYQQLNKISKNFGTKLSSPFMTLAFMSLLVIPELKLSDKGLFDGTLFNFTSLYQD